MLNAIQSWLSREDPLEKVDLLFVLAGLQGRKEYALSLFQEGWSRQILFSVGRFELRRFPKLGLPYSPDLLAIAKEIPPTRRHYFALLRDGEFQVNRIPVRQLGTLGEIDALADWLAMHPEVSSVSLVSSGPHLLRVLMCSKALLRRVLKVRFYAAREIPRGHIESGSESGDKECDYSHAEKSPKHWAGMLFELLKVASYAGFLPVWRVARRWRAETICSLALVDSSRSAALKD